MRQRQQDSNDSRIRDNWNSKKWQSCRKQGDDWNGYIKVLPKHTKYGACRDSQTPRGPLNQCSLHPTGDRSIAIARATPKVGSHCKRSRCYVVHISQGRKYSIGKPQIHRQPSPRQDPQKSRIAPTGTVYDFQCATTPQYVGTVKEQRQAAQGFSV